MVSVLRLVFHFQLILFIQNTAFCQKNEIPVNRDSLPILTFDQPDFELGKIDSGVVATFDMSFKNTGNKELIIEVVSACKCIEIEWPRTPILPNEGDVITVSFDTRGQKLGPIRKIIDIVANTEPIVVEAEMRCELIQPIFKE
ncbi:MAG: DUF1573 domain-containing protein [Saprospiraceae bacterium]